MLLCPDVEYYKKTLTKLETSFAQQTNDDFFNSSGGKKKSKSKRSKRTKK